MLAIRLSKLIWSQNSLQLAEVFDRLSYYYYMSGNFVIAETLAHQQATIVEYHYGRTSIEVCCEVIKHADLLRLILREQPKNLDVIKMYQARAKHAMKLLCLFALVDINPAVGAEQQLGQDSCYFVDEYRRFEKELKELSE